MIDQRLMIDVVAGPLMLCILIIQCLAFRHRVTASVSRYVKFILLSAMALIILGRTWYAVFSYGCVQRACEVIARLTECTYFSSRIPTFLFYIERAKISQGIQPVFPMKYFNKIFPSIVCVVGFVAVAGWALITSSKTFYCQTPKLQNTLELSICVQDFAVEPTNFIAVSIICVVEMTLTCFCMYLFLKPLHSIQVRNRRHSALKRMVQINVLGTFLGMLTSNISEVLFFSDAPLYHWLAVDAVVNVTSMFIMLRCNRDYFASLCCENAIGRRLGATKQSIVGIRQRIFTDTTHTGTKSSQPQRKPEQSKSNAVEQELEAVIIECQIERQENELQMMQSSDKAPRSLC